jgi:PAS domain S-box-containing protein
MSVNCSTKEQTFNESEILLSITSLDSRIKYANPEFCQIAGYTNEELKDKPHNTVRHPDMPKQAFKDLWTFIQQGKSWMGPVKNRCKNGDYYWVNAYVTPIKDKSGKNIEYQSVRTKLDSNVQKRAEDLYSKLNKGETPITVKYQIDQTLWIQAVLFLFTIASLALVITTDLNLLVTIPFLLMGIISSIISLRWRKKYQNILDNAKGIFDNSMMSYLYSGSNDATGTIELALAMRKAEINAVVGRVTDVSHHVSKSAATASDQSNQVSQKLKEQRDESEQVATAVNQMSATVQDLAKTLTGTAQSAKHGQELTTSGQQTIEASVNAINDLSIQLTEVDNMITKLSDGSKSINTVLSEISSIADQTNLLALNAAIEAARAGEQGRGFAVVAEEVRALAMRTQQSTEEIKNLLTQLQRDSDNAVVAMNKGSSLSIICVKLSNEAGDSLNSIHGEVMSISDATNQIATAIEEQSAVTEEISKKIVRINDITITCGESSKEASTLSSGLLDMLSEQESLVVQFKR